MSRPAKLTLEIVTAERVVYSVEDVDYVSAPGADGRLGILPRHAALFSLLSAGDLEVHKGDQIDDIVVFGGFLEVHNNRVLVLADAAERIEEIDLERAEEARRRAEALIAEHGSDVDMERALSALRRSTIRIQTVSRRRRITGGPGSSGGARNLN